MPIKYLIHTKTSVEAVCCHNSWASTSMEALFIFLLPVTFCSQSAESVETLVCCRQSLLCIALELEAAGSTISSKQLLFLTRMPMLCRGGLISQDSLVTQLCHQLPVPENVEGKPAEGCCQRTYVQVAVACFCGRGLALSRVTAASQELLHGEGILSDCGITTSREAQGAVSVPGKSMGLPPPSTGRRAFLQACQPSVAPVASWKNSSSAKTEVSYFA